MKQRMKEPHEKGLAIRSASSLARVLSRGRPRSVDRGIGGVGIQLRYIQEKERKLMCSVGDKPTEVKVRSLVAWIEGERETESLVY